MKRELLREAYAIIDGIPSDRFNLSYVLRRWPPDPNLCSTIACAAGWLAMHPEFAEKTGLAPSVEYFTTHVQLHGTQTRWAYAMGQVFNIPVDHAAELFNGNDNISGDDKSVWLQRVRHYLKEHKK